MEEIRVACQGANKVDFNSLVEFQGGLKKRTKNDIDKIAKSIKKYGFSFPFFVWSYEGTRYCIDGHGRLQALRVLESEGYIVPPLPVSYIEADSVDEAKNKLLRLNSQYGEMTVDSVLEFAGDIKVEWSDLILPSGKLSIHDDRHDDSIDAEVQIDRGEELRDEWGVEYGQIWKLGDHKLLCGDSTQPEDVIKLLNGERAQIVFTDPPYGVNIRKKNEMLNSLQKAGRNLKDIVDDDLKPEDLKLKLLPAFRNIKTFVMSDDCTVFVTAPQGGELGMMMMMMMKEAGLPPRHVLIWKKNSATFSMGRLDYDYQHEPILLTWGKKHKRPMAGKYRTSVWEIDKPRANKEHPTMKPVELVVNALLNNSDAGDVLFDAYCGSGTSILAAEQTSRKCFAVEISPEYVAVTLQRYYDATGIKPKKVM